MNRHDTFQIFGFVILLVGIAPPLGLFMAKVFDGRPTFLTPILGWLEKSTYRIAGIDEKDEMHWQDYTKALVWFNICGFLAVFLLQIIQESLPLNPQNLPNVSWHSAFNTAVSFTTNTNWQGYAGETTMSYLTQMLALTVQNFLSAATGIAALLGLIRGLSRRSVKTIGNFWVDLTRSIVYILLPLSAALSIGLVSQGVIQNFDSYIDGKTVEGAAQKLPMGPAASQIAIKQLGTNGGGFFNANSAHPFENPTPLSNFLEMFAILLLPAALVFMFGRMVSAPQHGWTVFLVMLAVWLASLCGSLSSEYATSPVSMEGKEVRIGIVNSLIWSTATTVASNGSVNAMHSSLSPMAGGIAMFNIMLGEVIFGGVGAGMYGMLHFILLTVFLSGLMVGRTPEYLGKKIEAKEMKMVVLAVLAPCAVILLGSAISLSLPVGLSSLGNKGPHGLSEVLYAYSSAAGNNGSAFAGLNANTVFYNLMLGFVILVGRFVVLIPALAIAGSLASKKISPPSSGTFSTDGFLFAVLLIGVIVIVGALTFLPSLSLGPIVEQFLLRSGSAFKGGP